MDQRGAAIEVSKWHSRYVKRRGERTGEREVNRREWSLGGEGKARQEDAGCDQETDLKCNIKQDRGDWKRVVRTFWRG